MQPDNWYTFYKWPRPDGSENEDFPVACRPPEKRELNVRSSSAGLQSPALLLRFLSSPAPSALFRSAPICCLCEIAAFFVDSYGISSFTALSVRSSSQGCTLRAQPSSMTSRTCGRRPSRCSRTCQGEPLAGPLANSLARSQSPKELEQRCRRLPARTRMMQPTRGRVVVFCCGGDES